MFDLKVIHAVLGQLEEERGIPKEKVIEAIEMALASAYRKEFGKRGQIVKAKFNPETGEVEFFQVKIVVDESRLLAEDEELTDEEIENLDPEAPRRVHFNEEQHILLDEADLIKKGSSLDDEIVFPLEQKEDFGRIAAQTAKQIIMQKIREAEKTSVLGEFGTQIGEIVSGSIQRVERGNIFLDMDRAVGQIAYNEQIPNENFKQGERVRAYLYDVEEGGRGVFLKLSRSHPKFLEALFRAEVPELTQEIVEIKAIAREAGSRSKVAVQTNDDHVDPVGALVGQRGVRVSTIMSELSGEKIDIIEHSEDPSEFIREALSPAQIIEIEVNEETSEARVMVAEDQQSLAIGKGGQNVRLAAKLTGWKIDIQSTGSNEEDENKEEVETEVEEVESQEVSEEVTESTEEVVEETKEEVETEKTDDTDTDEESEDQVEEESAEEEKTEDETPEESEEK